MIASLRRFGIGVGLVGLLTFGGVSSGFAQDSAFQLVQESEEAKQEMPPFVEKKGYAINEIGDLKIGEEIYDFTGFGEFDNDFFKNREGYIAEFSDRDGDDVQFTYFVVDEMKDLASLAKNAYEQADRDKLVLRHGFFVTRRTVSGTDFYLMSYKEGDALACGWLDKNRVYAVSYEEMNPDKILDLAQACNQEQARFLEIFKKKKEEELRKELSDVGEE